MDPTATSPLVSQLLSLALSGADWILWALLGLSVLSVSLILERVWWLWKTARFSHVFEKNLLETLDQKTPSLAEELCQKHPHLLESQLVREGFQKRHLSLHSWNQHMASLLVTQRQCLERGLVILATLGHNAPFLGLFGTVMGIIKSLHDLSQNPAGGASLVMAGISEALVATAVGILVALPAAVSFNLLQKAVKNRMTSANALVNTLGASLFPS